MTEAPEKPAEQPTPAKAPETALEKAAVKAARTQGQRSLFIMVMLMFFVSIVVFVVGTYFFMVPRVLTQSLEIRHLQMRLNAFEEALTAPDPAMEEAGTPEAAPAAPAAPEVKPVKPDKPEKKAPAKKKPAK